MPETAAATYASFAATHEDRLVRSLVSESGLSPAAAALAAADVLPAGFERSFPTRGAAYGWLRVAARHRAAGSAEWADAADTAVCQAAAARAALAALPAEDRELLRLRCADGVLPAELAERLGVSVTDVLVRLDRAVALTRAAGDGAAAGASGAAGAAPDAVPAAAAPAARRIPFPRLAAAGAAAAAALLLGTGSAPTTEPPLATAPWPSVLDRDSLRPAAGEAPVAASETGRADVPAARAAGVRAERAVVPPQADAPTQPDEPGRCRTRSQCRQLFDEIRVAVPKQVADVTGQREIVVAQEHGGEYIHACDVLAPVPAGVARCNRGEP